MGAQVIDAFQATVNHPKKSQYQQIARSIVQLRDDLHQQYPQLAMPTSWMIDCLVFNCPASDFDNDNDNWQDTVNTVMDRISDDMARDYGGECRYYQTDGVTPLFPNQDLYDETDVYHFCQRLLQHLEQALA